MSNESAIQQINLSFNLQEDRLLLKIGLADKTEVTVWITRRIFKDMSSVLQGIGEALLPTSAQFAALNIATPDAKNQAIESFQKEQLVQKNIENLDFKSGYVADRQARTDVPMLAIQCLVVTIESQLPQLELQCSNGESVKIALNNELVAALTSMMHIVISEANWNMHAVVENAQVSITPNLKTMH